MPFLYALYAGIPTAARIPTIAMMDTKGVATPTIVTPVVLGTVGGPYSLSPSVPPANIRYSDTKKFRNGTINNTDHQPVRSTSLKRRLARTKPNTIIGRYSTNINNCDVLADGMSTAEATPMMNAVTIHDSDIQAR